MYFLIIVGKCLMLAVSLFHIFFCRQQGKLERTITLARTLFLLYSRHLFTSRNLYSVYLVAGYYILLQVLKNMKISNIKWTVVYPAWINSCHIIKISKIYMLPPRSFFHSFLVRLVFNIYLFTLLLCVIAFMYT